MKDWLFGLFVLMSGTLIANDYMPLVREGVRWEYTHFYSDLINDVYKESTQWIEIKGDTIIGDLSYKKCWQWIEGENPVVVGMLREDIETKKVYKLYMNFHEEYLLYDFNDITQSDYLKPYNLDINDDVKTENILIDGISVKKYTINNTIKAPLFYIIEGIGYVHSDIFHQYCGNLLEYPITQQFDSNSQWSEFRCLKDLSGIILFDASSAGIENVTDDNYITIRIENNDNIYIKTKLAVNSAKLIDVNGRVIQALNPNTSDFRIDTSDINNGCYIIQIQNGKGLYSRKLLLNN